MRSCDEASLIAVHGRVIAENNFGHTNPDFQNPQLVSNEPGLALVEVKSAPGQTSEVVYLTDFGSIGSFVNDDVHPRIGVVPNCHIPNTVLAIEEAWSRSRTDVLHPGKEVSAVLIGAGPIFLNALPWVRASKLREIMKPETQAPAALQAFVRTNTASSLTAGGLLHH